MERNRNRLISSLRWLTIFYPIALLAQGGCVAGPGSQPGHLVSHSESRSWPQAMQILEDRVSLIEAHMTYCSDEVKRLLGQVEQACNRADVCTEGETDILVEVLRSDPHKEGRFLTLMQDRKHAVFYLPSEGRLLTDPERKQLRDLVKPAWFDEDTRRTRFLVVSHPEDTRIESMERAQRRGNRVIDAIKQISREMGVKEPLTEQDARERAQTAGAAMSREGADAVLVASRPGAITAVPKGTATEAEPPPAPGNAAASLQPAPQRRILHWIFPFSVKGEALRSEDRPRAASDKVHRSVWVFRVDC
ncbi:MAG: hypothetical protein U1A78_17700 [Polyangia bacterium]